MSLVHYSGNDGVTLCGLSAQYVNTTRTWVTCTCIICQGMKPTCRPTEVLPADRSQREPKRLPLVEPSGVSAGGASGMTVAEAGRRGGRKTYEKYGHVHYVEMGRKGGSVGGARLRKLVEAGKLVLADKE